MAIAWSRISSKVIAHPPDAEAACSRRCGNGKSRLGSLYRTWVTKESRSDHDPLQKGENRTRLSGSTDAQPSVLAPRVRDPEDVPRESRRVRVLLGRVRGQPCTDRVRRLPSATNDPCPLQLPHTCVDPRGVPIVCEQ